MNKNDYEELNRIISDYSENGESIDILLKNNKTISIDFPKDDHIDYISTVSDLSDSQIMTIFISHERLLDRRYRYTSTEWEVHINLNAIVAIMNYPLKDYEHPGIYINENK